MSLKNLQTKVCSFNNCASSVFSNLFLHYFSERRDINSQPRAMSSLEASRNRSDILVLLDRCNSVNLLLEQKCLSHALHFSGKLCLGV